MSRRVEPVTGDLFSTIPSPLPQKPASMDFRRTVSQLTSQGLKEFDGSRYQVAARMSELADVETSKALLDSYTAETREECNMPLWKAPVFEAATNTRALAEWHAGVLGGRVLWGNEVMDADIGKRERLIEELQQEVKALKAYRKGMR